MSLDSFLSQEPVSIEQLKVVARLDMIDAVNMPIGIFISRREKWVKKRVMTEEEINNIPDVINGAVKSIEVAKKTGSRSFDLRKREWVDAGVISKGIADNI